MSETIDPIIWLREYVTNNKKIELNQSTNMLEFENSSIKMHINTQTAWKRKNGNGHYTLGSLWLLLDKRSLNTGDFMRIGQ